jgi:hypothetical protein
MKTSILVSRAHCCPRWRIVSTLVPLCFIAVVQPGYTMEKGEYPAPALDQFQPAGESEDDVDGDGVNETLIRRYINEAGESIFSLTTGDRLWAWSIAIPVGGQLDPTKSYLIRDSKCDGVFDEKYATDEDVQIPACLK